MKMNFTTDGKFKNLSTEWKPLPKGRYHVVIKELAVSKDTSYFKCVFQILNHPTLGGRTVRSLPIFDNNPDPVKQARSDDRLNNLLVAINMFSLVDTQQLLNKELDIDVVVTEGKGEYAGKLNNMVANFYKHLGKAEIATLLYTRLDGREIATPTNQAPVAQAPVAQAPVAGNNNVYDDDIPF